MTAVNPSNIRWFKFRSWCGLVALVLLALLFHRIGGEFILGILICFYLHNRDRKLRQMQIAARDGVGHDTASELKKMDEVIASSHLYQLASQFDGYAPCRTCGTPIPVHMFEDMDVCWELRDLFPHRPSDPPPSPNLYEHWWYQFHGYEPPPSYACADYVYLHPYATDPNYTQKAKDLGRKYYAVVFNHAWDMGQGEIPDWYVVKRIERAA